VWICDTTLDGEPSGTCSPLKVPLSGDDHATLQCDPNVKAYILDMGRALFLGTASSWFSVNNLLTSVQPKYKNTDSMTGATLASGQKLASIENVGQTFLSEFRAYLFFCECHVNCNFFYLMHFFFYSRRF